MQPSLRWKVGIVRVSMEWVSMVILTTTESVSIGKMMIGKEGGFKVEACHQTIVGLGVCCQKLKQHKATNQPEIHLGVVF